MGNRIRDIKRIAINTTSSSPVVFFTYSTINNTIFRIRIESISKRTSTTDGYCNISERLFKNVSGTINQIGSTTTIFNVSDSSLSSSTITTNISGSNLELIVTPPALTIEWEFVIYIEVN